ncbi:aldehyde dehydrogenase family protein [Halomonas sediminis]
MTGKLDEWFTIQRHAADLERYPGLATRRARLSRLARMTRHHQQAIVQAIQADFGQRSETEIRLAEISAVVDAVRHARWHLRRWMRPRRVSVPWRLLPAKARIMPQPLGVVGIISPWNYPWSLALLPAVDALAAGNRVMLKPSEHTPHTSTLLAQLIPQYFSAEELCVVEGDAELSRHFSALPFDHLVFTGSTTVGRRVAKAAAENLTPVTLELGGKSPAVIGADADLDQAASAITFGKGFNHGQTCIAPDYVLVESRRLTDFIKAMSRAIEHQRSHNSRDATAIINPGHQQRLRRMLDEARDHGCRVIEFGDSAPALIIDPHQSLEIMQQEIFGPWLPIIGVKDIPAATSFINARPSPLALYAFTHDKATQQELAYHTRSGALVFNETLLHHAIPQLPFGGVGESGMGAYHGRHGFERFSHLRGLMYQSRHPTTRLVRPPYRRWLLKLLGY